MLQALVEQVVECWLAWNQRGWTNWLHDMRWWLVTHRRGIHYYCFVVTVLRNSTGLFDTWEIHGLRDLCLWLLWTLLIAWYVEAVHITFHSWLDWLCWFNELKELGLFQSDYKSPLGLPQLLDLSSDLNLIFLALGLESKALCLNSGKSLIRVHWSLLVSMGHINALTWTLYGHFFRKLDSFFDILKNLREAVFTGHCEGVEAGSLFTLFPF